VAVVAANGFLFPVSWYSSHLKAISTTHLICAFSATLKLVLFVGNKYLNSDFMLNGSFIRKDEKMFDNFFKK